MNSLYFADEKGKAQRGWGICTWLQSELSDPVPGTKDDRRDLSFGAQYVTTSHLDGWGLFLATYR